MQNLMTLSMWSRFGEQIYKHIAQQIFISQRLIDDDNVFSLVSTFSSQTTTLVNDRLGGINQQMANFFSKKERKP